MMQIFILRISVHILFHLLGLLHLDIYLKIVLFSIFKYILFLFHFASYSRTITKNLKKLFIIFQFMNYINVLLLIVL